MCGRNHDGRLGVNTRGQDAVLPTRMLYWGSQNDLRFHDDIACGTGHCFGIGSAYHEV
jgi:hypothetical protein